MAGQVIALGRDQFLFVNTGILAGDGSGTFVETDLARDVTKDNARDFIDATTRGSARSGYKRNVPNLKDYRVSTELLIPAEGQTANAANDAIIEGFDDDIIVEVVLARGNILTGTAVEAQFCEVFIGGGSESQPLEDVLALSIEMANA